MYAIILVCFGNISDILYYHRRNTHVHDVKLASLRSCLRKTGKEKLKRCHNKWMFQTVSDFHLCSRRTDNSGQSTSAQTPAASEASEVSEVSVTF